MLDSFNAGPFPKNEDVLRHLYFYLESMAKKDVDLAAWSTADLLHALGALVSTAHDEEERQNEDKEPLR